jgi:hypothetical protein
MPEENMLACQFIDMLNAWRYWQLKDFAKRSVLPQKTTVALRMSKPATGRSGSPKLCPEERQLPWHLTQEKVRRQCKDQRARVKKREKSLLMK